MNQPLSSWISDQKITNTCQTKFIEIGFWIISRRNLKIICMLMELYYCNLFMVIDRCFISPSCCDLATRYKPQQVSFCRKTTAIVATLMTNGVWELNVDCSVSGHHCPDVLVKQRHATEDSKLAKYGFSANVMLKYLQIFNDHAHFRYYRK